MNLVTAALLPMLVVANAGLEQPHGPDPGRKAFRALARAIDGDAALELPAAYDLLATAHLSINERCQGAPFKGMSPLMYAIHVMRKNGGHLCEAMVAQARQRAAMGQLAFHINPFEMNSQMQTLLLLAAKAHNGIIVQALLEGLTPEDRQLILHTPDVYGDIPFSHFQIEALRPAPPAGLAGAAPMGFDDVKAAQDLLRLGSPTP